MMEVKYPIQPCIEGHSHYYIEAVSLSGIFQCKYCKSVKWQPVYWSDAVKFSELIKKYGLDKAYNKSIEHRKKTKSIINAISKIDGLVLPEEVMQELRAENVDSDASPWTNSEANETMHIEKDRKIGTKKRRSERCAKN